MKSGTCVLAVAALCGLTALGAASVPLAQFEPAVAFDTGEALPADIERADFNNDGYADLAVLTTQGGSKINILLGDGQGRLLLDTTTVVPYGVGFTAADFNRDGRLDLAVTQTSNKISSDGLCAGTTPGTLIFLGDGAPSPRFTFHACLAAPAAFLNDAAAADFDGDGRIDLAVADSGIRGMRVHPGNGDGTFSAAIPAIGSTNVAVGGPMTAVDVNRDGALDLIARLSGGGVATFIGDGTGTLTFHSTAVGSPQVVIHSGVVSFAVGDVNGDGLIDIAGVERGTLAGSATPQNVVFSALGTGDGLTYATTPQAQTLSASAAATAALLDFDKDRALDLVIVQPEADAVHLFAGAGDGTFTDGPVLAVGLQPQFLATGDWNGDNWIDLAVVDRNQASQSRTWVLQQRPGSADASGPTVALTSPSAGSALSGLVRLNATASDPDGVARVEFYLVDATATTRLALSSSAPYSFDWDTTSTPNGPYTLVARAFDALDNASTSPALAVTVANSDTTPPSVTLTSPAAATRVGGVVTLSAAATDANGVTRLDFLLDNAVIATAAAAPYELAWDTTQTAAGVHSLVAKAYDAAGNAGVSASLSLTIDQTPSVSAGPPRTIEATSAAGALVRLTGAATDPDPEDPLTFLWSEEGATLATTLSLEATLAPGIHVLVLRATDSFGASAEDSVEVTIDDTTAPDVAIRSPASGARVTGAVQIDVSATDAVGVTSVAFFAGAEPLGEATSAPWTVVWNTAGAPHGSSVVLRAVASDASGNAGESSIVVVVEQPDVEPPIVSAPPAIVIAATEAAGARANVPASAASVALAAFLSEGAASDARDPSPQRLAPQAWAGGVAIDVDAATVFPVGSTEVLFRFRDAAGNLGSAPSVVTVAEPVGAAVNAANERVAAADNHNVPQPVIVSFAEVSQPGLLIADVLTAAPDAPAGYGFAGPVFDVSTTALVGGSVVVCLQGTFSSLDAVLHYVNGAWIDETSTRSATELCATTTSLSPFAAATMLNHAPDANAGPFQTVEATAASGAPVTLSGAGSDADGDALTFVWREGATTLGSGEQLIVTLPIGLHDITLTVSDGRGESASASTRVVVRDSIAPAVTLTAPANGALVSGTVTVAASASDAVGVDRVEFSANGVSIGSRTGAPFSVAWDSASLAPGTTVTLTARAVDAAGNADDDTIVVTIAAPDAAAERPRIVAPDAADDLAVGEPFTYQFAASGTPPIIWWLERAPAGMTIDAASGVLAWTPTADQVGRHAAIVRAQNAAGEARTLLRLRVVDRIAPAAPGGLQAAVARERIALTWSPAADNVAVAYYRVYEYVQRRNRPAAWEVSRERVRGTFALTEDVRRGVHRFAVTAVDASGNESLPSDPVTVVAPFVSGR